MNNTNASTPDLSTPTAIDFPDPQGPVPAPCPQGGRSPARPSSSAVSGENGNGIPERGCSFTATYSPDDNKLRLYASRRLDASTYERVKAAGFRWAPKQDLFVAPMWTPAREDLLIELCGEIDDEDTSLVERQEQRAERFEGYSERRADDAQSAHAAVSRIADNIPFGQPILVGHHSERHARRDAEKIRSGMDRAVKKWKTSTYWTERAAGALRHAKYKELPAVRARRIKTIEAECRGYERDIAKSRGFVKCWTGLADADSITRKDGQPTTFAERVAYAARAGAGCRYELHGELERGEISPEAARDSVIAGHERLIVHYERWIAHCENRLAYERAMLAESGWTPPPKPKTKADLPLLNYAGAVAYQNPYTGDIVRCEAVPMTKAELAKVPSDYKGTRMSDCGTHRLRLCVQKGHVYVIVFLTDSKQHARPGAADVEQAAAEAEAAHNIAVRQALSDAQKRAAARETAAPAVAAKAKAAAPFEAIAESLKTGVQVVTAPQLFPTPAALAERMAREADIGPTTEVLEPSAGTGAIWRELSGKRTAVEVNSRLADGLRGMCTQRDSVICSDFLACAPERLGMFDRIVMNPPFTHGADIAHIKHALTFLRPGGRLVAICANGPRQRAALMPIVEKYGGAWEDLPADTFKESGTAVRVALICVALGAAYQEAGVSQ